jgi:hypothetical protein
VITIFPAWSHSDGGPMGDLRSAATRFSGVLEVCEIDEQPDWFEVVQDNIRRANCVVLILTANSAVSPNCEREVSYAGDVGTLTLIWSPGKPLAIPEWAKHATLLSEMATDAGQALASALKLVNHPLG